jgi:hypothetical protein
MAFVCEQYAPASAAALLAEIEVMLVAAGWTLHDNVSATVKVYSSNGEAGDRITEYIWFSLAANTITVIAYGWWNNATHAGNCASSGGGTTIVWAAAEVRIIGGNKDIFYVYKTATWCMFGHIPKRIDVKPLATLTAPAALGLNAILTVDNVDMFAPNLSYLIFGSTGEGRYPLKIVSIVPGSITVANLTVNMAAGAKIGATPSIFGIGSNVLGLGMQLTCTYDMSGTGVAGTAASFNPLLAVGNVDPDNRLGNSAVQATAGLFVLQPAFLSEVNLNSVGYIDTNVLIPPIATNWMTYANVSSSGAALDTGTATAGANTTITCAGKLWGINAYANKIVVLISGASAGQTRRIISNTAVELTVAQWDTNPNITTIFGIYDEVYRVAASYAYKEVINS